MRYISSTFKIWLWPVAFVNVLVTSIALCPRKTKPSSMPRPADLSFHDVKVTFGSQSNEVEGQWFQTLFQGNETPQSPSQLEDPLDAESWYGTVFDGDHTFPSYATTRAGESSGLWALSSSAPATRESDSTTTQDPSTTGKDSSGKVIKKKRVQKKATTRTVNQGYECGECLKRGSECRIRLNDPTDSQNCLKCADAKTICNRSLVLQEKEKASSQAYKRKWINKKNAEKRKNGLEAPGGRRASDQP